MLSAESITISNEKIAVKISRSPATVERKLSLIRKAWAKEIDE